MACIRLIFFLLLASAPALADTKLSFEETDGLFTVRRNTMDAVTADFVFWKKRWEWAGTKIKAAPSQPGVHAFNGTIRGLDVAIKGTATAYKSNEMSWVFDLSSAQAWEKAFGGIAFKLNRSAFKSVVGFAEPELLPERSGWRIRTGSDKEFLTVRFDPPLASIYFERGKKDEIRAYFFDNGIPPGLKQVRMTVTLPENGRVVPTLSERLGPGPDNTWYRDALYWATSPVDLSFMNVHEKPAGKRGFLKAEGENLVFEDGTKARFWGTNVSAYALFQTNSVDVRRHARRLSKLGFNLVRIHHHDNAWVRPNIFGHKPADTLVIDDTMLKKIDWWIKSLKDEGIYVWLDLNVGREFTAKDKIKDFAELPNKTSARMGRGFAYVNADMQQRLMEFNQAYLNHINPFTGLAYKDDPAIVTLLITNENDLTAHFGNFLYPNKNVPAHSARYMAQSKAFAELNNLPSNKTWRAWEHGPSKLFVNDLEHSFNEKMIGHLRGIGTRAPIVTTHSWGDMPLSSLPALTDSDIIDVHSYGGANAVEGNPRFKPNFVHWVAMAQAANKPVSISEWNVSGNLPFDRHIAPMYFAAIANLQKWDASMYFNYSNASLSSKGRARDMVAFNDPGALAMMSAAALIFRQEHVRQAERTYALKLDAHTFFYREVSPKTSATIRTIAEQSRLVIELPETPELPWLKPAKADDDAIIVTDTDKDFLPAGQNFVRSDTGEIYRNWEDGIFTINTEKSQVAAGWLGGKSVILKDILVDLVTKNASVAVQSLTDQPVRNSDNILISLAARSVPSPGNKLPFLSEPVVGTLTIKAREGLQLFALDRAGKEKPVPVRFHSDRYVLDLDHKLGTYWLKLRVPDGAGAAPDPQ